MLTHTHLFDLAWAEMYSVLATFIWRFNFRFVKAKAEDLECISDQFFIGTRGSELLEAYVEICAN